MITPSTELIPISYLQAPRLKPQTLYNGVRLLNGYTPDLDNIWKIDKGALPMISRMQARGLQVDLAHFAKMDVELTQSMDRLTEQVRSMTGYYCNLGSGDQVSDLLFKKMGLKQARRKMTATEERESVAEEVLTAIQHQHPVVGLCLEYKEYEKLRGTYVRPMPRLATCVGSGGWRMFPNFRTTRVPSGRLSCSDPNLLAMPNRTEMGREIRKGFITDPGWCYLSVDESQIEVRIAAHRSRDTNLCNVYHNQEDVYSDFAISAFRIPDQRYRDDKGWHYPGVDKQAHRFPSKTCTLAAIYDVTAGGLQEQMPVVCGNCNKPTMCLLCEQGKPDHVCIKHECNRYTSLWTENRCQDILNSFYLRYPSLMHMRMADHKYMRSHAMSCDIWGRILHVQAVRSVLKWVVSGALREGANFPMQSSAQGTIKLTMAAVDDDLAGMYGDVVWPLLQVHDELLFEVREDCTEEIGELVKYRFETCCELEVPIKAEYAMAPTWGEIQK